MRILWHSNAPWASTGYGNQTAVFAGRLKRAGHDIAISAFYGLQGGMLHVNGNIPVYSAGLEQFGNDTLAPDAMHWRAHAVITLMDIWVLNPDVVRGLFWLPWIPIDHDPIPPAVLEMAQLATVPIAMSEFGQKQLQNRGIDARYVPHGVDVAEFRPEPMKTAREQLGIPDDVFLVGLVSANKGTPSRKAFEPQLWAFAQLHKKHPDSKIYIHTDRFGRMGEDLQFMTAALGIPKSAMVFVDPYAYDRGLLGFDYMRTAYSAMDVLTHATRGEGFGIPQIEAMACGTPVIATNFSAMTEIVQRGAGWLVNPIDMEYSPQSSYQAQPNRHLILEAMEQAYKAKGRQEIREKARAGMLSYYDAELVLRRDWLPMLDEIAQLIGVEPLPKRIQAPEPMVIEDNGKLAVAV